MARQFKLFGQQITIGKRLFGTGRADEDYFAMFSNKYGTDANSRQRLDSYKGIVYGSVSLIGEQCGAYLPKIMRRKGDQLEALDTHPLYDLLRYPSGRDPKATSISQFDLFEATASFLALQGEVFWYLAKGVTSGLPREIVILRADRVGIDIDKDTGDVNGYFIRRTTGPAIPMDVDEVLHFRYFNPKDAYHGMGTVEAADDYIGTDESTAKFTRNFFNNNAGLSGVLSVQGEVTKGAFKKFVRAWRDKYEGVDNAGKVAIIRDTDANFTKVGLGLDELDMGALRKMTQDDVLLMFRVPLPLLGKAEQTGLGRANVEALEYIFAKYNIDMKLQRFDRIMEIMLARYYGGADLIVQHKNIIPDDKEFELTKRDKAVDRWQTRDEIRDEDGLDSVDGGDQLFVPMANIPIGDAGSMSTAASSAAAAGGKGDANKGKIVLTIKRTRKADAPAETPKKKDDEPVEPGASGIDVQRKEQFRLRLMRNQALYERKYSRTFKPLLAEQKKEALYNLEAHASALAGIIGKDAQQRLFDDAAWDAKMTGDIVPVLTDMAGQQGALALTFAGDTESEFKLTVNFKQLLERATLKMVKGFNDETIEKLNDTLAEGIAEGEGLGKLKNRVNEVYDMAENYRNMRVARTETLRTSNAATTEAYKQTGYVKAKEWYTNPGACDICDALDGKVVGLDESYADVGQNIDYTDASGEQQQYAVTYDNVDDPPVHPNCRCTIIPVT